MVLWPTLSVFDSLWFVVAFEMKFDVDFGWKSKENKGSAAENFPQETLSSLEKSVISWCRNVEIDFHLLRLKLNSEYCTMTILEFFSIPMNICDFSKLTEFPHLFCFLTGWSSNLKLVFDRLVDSILQRCLLRNYNSFNLFSNGIKFINFGLGKLELWFFK